MNTISALIANAREREDTFIEAVGRSAPYTTREFCTNCWKAGNLFGHYGVHPGSDVAVVFGPKPGERNNSGEETELGEETHSPVPEGTIDSADPLLAVVGATLIRARANLTPETPVETRALVRPAGEQWRNRYPTTARCSTLAYGGPPTQSSVVHFEAKLWSQNPTPPPETVDAETPALVADGSTYTHGQLLAATERIIDSYGIDESTRIAFPLNPTDSNSLLADFREPGAFVAGVLVPLYCGGTMVLGSSDGATLVIGEGTETDLSVRELTAEISSVA